MAARDNVSAKDTWEVPDSIWYKAEIGRRLKPEIKEVYTSWAGLHEDELLEHLHAIRDRAWESHRYPCIGQWGFLQSSLVHFTVLPQLIERLKHNPKCRVLDVGTGLGQDLRFLASHGVPTQQMYATDISSGLWQIGFELFRDQSRFMAQFEAGDFKAGADQWTKMDWRSKFDVIMANQFFHLFSWTDQIRALSQVVNFSRPGSTLIGFQRAQDLAIEVVRDWGTSFFHDASTFRAMWDQVQQDTASEWTVEYEMIDCRDWGLELEDIDWMPPGAKFVQFTCTRDS